ncbi:MAG: pyroglutamyl-peptidase I [Candidatus Eremiobacteraeota bacterium]|nr:pyroglutamyl-peptidase I [Candidatus Eremiobacteraeota bacterium]
MSKHILLAGFEPFGEFKVNPSELLVRSFEGRLIAGRLIVSRVFPVETKPLEDRLRQVLHEEKPEVVIGAGLASGRTGLALERLGVNLMNFSKPDAVGVVRHNDPIQRGGPEARLVTIPLDAIKTAWDEQGVPGYVSNDAGTYICNQFLYTSLGLAPEINPPPVCGFVHLPCLPAQAIELGAEKTPSMSLETMKKGLEVMIEIIVPWLEAKPIERVAARGPAQSVWIPRGLKEVER